MVDGYNRAKAAGVPFSFVMDHDVARSLYQNDPDGNMVEIYADVEKDWRAMRQGIIVKEKPKWVPGVTSAPLQEKCYPQEPVLAKLKDAVFHPKKVTHVALVARNFEAMFDFYVNSVGLTALVGDRDSDLALLKGTASDAFTGSVLAMVRVPVCAPALAGLKRTVTVVLAPQPP